MDKWLTSVEKVLEASEMFSFVMAVRSDELTAQRLFAHQMEFLTFCVRVCECVCESVCVWQRSARTGMCVCDEKVCVKMSSGFYEGR